MLQGAGKSNPALSGFFKSEVVNKWRRLVLPIMPPGSVSFHAFPHIPQGLHSQVKHVFVYD